MLEMQTSRTEAQKIYTVVHNVDADSVTTGMLCNYVGGGVAVVSADGISVVKTTAVGDFKNMAGIAKKDIPADEFGLVQCWGYVDSIHISGEAIKTVGPGLLKPGAIAGTLFSVQTDQAVSTMFYRTIEAWTTIDVGAAIAYGSGFIRAL